MENINAIIMLEILGKPAEHITKVLNEIVDKLGEEKELEIVSRKIAEPKPIENDLFTSFAEFEIKTGIEKLISICFSYMPSHVEIISPEELKIKNNDLNMILNELTRRLHQYDELAKGLMIEREILAKKIESGEIKVKEEKKVKKKKKRKK